MRKYGVIADKIFRDKKGLGETSLSRVNSRPTVYQEVVSSTLLFCNCFMALIHINFFIFHTVHIWGINKYSLYASIIEN